MIVFMNHLRQFIAKFIKSDAFGQLIIRYHTQRFMFLLLRVGKIVGHISDIVFIISPCKIEFFSVKEVGCVVKEIRIDVCSIWYRWFCCRQRWILNIHIIWFNSHSGSYSISAIQFMKQALNLVIVLDCDIQLNH